MLSMIFNKSVQSDPTLINDFSRIATVVNKKLHGTHKRSANKPKVINIVMDERNSRTHASTSGSNLSFDGDARTDISSDVFRIPSARNRAEESINSGVLAVNPVSLAHFHSYVQGPPVNSTHFHGYVQGSPLYQYPVPWQSYNCNLIYRNYSQAALQPHLSQIYFHRPNQDNQERLLQSSSNNACEKSLRVFRFWEKVSQTTQNPGLVFSVMSYNILAQDLLQQHPYLYRSHNPKFLGWEVRWKNLLSEIQALSPDILCLQEVQATHIDAYFSVLGSLGYKKVYKQRTGIRSDGCAIFYKDKLVTLTEYTTVEFNQPNVPVLNRDNVAVIVKFLPRQHPKREFVVATTHLLFNPKRQDVRLAQTQLLLTEVERLAFHKRGNYLPVIITGDLNATPDSAVYRFITKGKLRYENLESKSLQRRPEGAKTGKILLPPWLRVTDDCQHADLISTRTNNQTLSRSEEVNLIELKHSELGDAENKRKNTEDDASLFSTGILRHKFPLESVYKHQVGEDPEATTYQDKWVSVDYIFFSSSRAQSKPPRSTNLILLERYRLPTVKELDEIKIPNMEAGSDHLSLMAKFELTTV